MKNQTTVDKPLVERILRETDPVVIVGGYTHLTLHGNIYTGQCPLCDSNKQRLVVQPKLHKWHCFSCGKHGNIFDFLVEKEAFTYDEAVKYVSVKLFEHDSDLASLHHTQLPRPSDELRALEEELAREAAKRPPVVEESIATEIPPEPIPAFEPADMLCALLKTVVGYKYTVILAEDFRILATNIPEELAETLQVKPFCQKMQPLLDALAEETQGSLVSAERHLLVRDDNGSVLTTTTRYQGQTVHVVCLLEADANMVLIKRYIADTLSSQ